MATTFKIARILQTTALKNVLRGIMMGIGPIWGIRSLNLSSLGLSEQIERPMPIPIFLNSLARFGNNPHLQLRMQLYEATVYMHAP